MHANSSHTSKKLCRAKEVARELGGIGVRTLYRMAAQGSIPFYRAGKTGVRFDLQEVRDALHHPGTGANHG